MSANDRSACQAVSGTAAFPRNLELIRDDKGFETAPDSRFTFLRDNNATDFLPARAGMGCNVVEYGLVG